MRVPDTSGWAKSLLATVALLLSWPLPCGVARGTDPFDGPVEIQPQPTTPLAMRYALLGFVRVNGEPVVYLVDCENWQRVTVGKAPDSSGLCVEHLDARSNYTDSIVTIRRGPDVARLRFGEMPEPPAMPSGHLARLLESTTIDGFFQNSELDDVLALITRRLSRKWPRGCRYYFRGTPPKKEGICLVFRDTPARTALEMLSVAIGMGEVIVQDDAIVFAPRPGTDRRPSYRENRQRRPQARGMPWLLSRIKPRPPDVRTKT